MAAMFADGVITQCGRGRKIDSVNRTETMTVMLQTERKKKKYQLLPTRPNIFFSVLAHCSSHYGDCVTNGRIFQRKGAVVSPFYIFPSARSDKTRPLQSFPSVGTPGSGGVTHVVEIGNPGHALFTRFYARKKVIEKISL